MAPEAEARSEPTPPSKRMSSTVRFSSLKYPNASATYGVRCTTLGGVTGTAIVTFFAAQVAFAAAVAVADAAATAAVDAPPLVVVDAHAPDTIARTRPNAMSARGCFSMPDIPTSLLLAAQPRRDAAFDRLHETHE